MLRTIRRLWNRLAKNNPFSRKARSRARRRIFEPLESRVCLSGAWDIVLIDNTLDRPDLLAKAALEGTRVLLYDGQNESPEQVLNRVVALSQSSGWSIGSLSILSHGSEGRFSLGDQVLTARDLSDMADAWKRLGAAMSADGNIYLYGCNVASPFGGNKILDRLAHLTGAEVFASTNLTGFGGDWILEAASTGAEAELSAGLQSAFSQQKLSAYEGTLPVGGFDNNQDLGSVSLSGSASYDSETGVYTVNGSGGDIWGSSDKGHYVYLTANGDGEIIARPTSIENTHPNAKAGVMFRDSAASNAAYAYLLQEPDGDIFFHYRASNGANTSSNASLAGLTVGTAWLRLVRAGSSFSAYYSTNGSSWTQLGTSQTVTMATTATAGLAVCTANNYDDINTSTFDNVSTNLVVIPAAPSVVKANATSSSSILVQWTDNSANETGFKIERAYTHAGGGGWVEVDTVGANVTSFTDTGLAEGTTYHYRVRAFNLGGNSAYNTADPREYGATTFRSHSVKEWVFVPKYQTQSGGVDNYDEAIASTEVGEWVHFTDFNFDEFNVTQFRLRVASDFAGGKLEVRLDSSTGTKIAEVTVSDTGGWVAPYYADHTVALTQTVTGTHDVYLVFTAASVGGGVGNIQQFTFGTTVVAEPTNFSSSAVAAKQINLTWTDNSNNETGFIIERSTSEFSGFTVITTTAANATSYSDLVPSTGTTYYYRIRATHATGQSRYTYPAISNSTLATPTYLSAITITATSVTLGWTDNSSNETGFTIERSATSNFSSIAATYTVGANVTSYTIGSLTSGGTYYFRIRATHSGGASANSNTASATTVTSGTAPAAPGGLGATAASKTQINLAWTDNSNNESGFKIERSLDGSNWTQIATTSAGVTSYSDTGLNAGTTYYYRVRAYNNTGNSGYSNTASTATGANATPSVTTTGGNLAYTENAGTVVLDSGLTLSDADDTLMEGATIQITGNYASGQDVLSFTNQNGIVGSWDPSTGTLTLTGTSSVANYQTALRSITFSNANENPSTLARTVTFSVSDGLSSGSATRGITVTAVNDAPVNSLPAAQNAQRNTPLVFSSANGNLISIVDIDATSGSLQVSLSVTNGTLTLSGTTGLSFSVGDGTADASMTFTGTISQINTALAGMSYTPTTNYVGSATLSITTNDQGNVGSGGAQSDTDNLSISVMLESPTNLTARPASTTQINLSWTDTTSDETGFQIERSTDGTNWTLIHTTAANATSYSDTGLSVSTTYYYRIRATNGSTYSAYTATVHAPTMFNGSPIGDDFNYTNGANLVGQSGGNGWSGSWANGTITPTATINSTGVTYSTLLTSGGRVSISAGEATRTLSSSLGANGTTRWFSFLFRKDSGSGSSQRGGIVIEGSGYRLYVGYFGSGGSPELFVENLNAGTRTGLGIHAGAGTVHFLAFKIDFAAGNDTVSVYTNPTPGSTAPTTAAATYSAADLGTVSGVSVKANNSTTSLDEIRVGESYDAVAPTNDAPSGLTATASGTQINLSWTDNTSDELGFRIERSPDGSTWTDVGYAAAGATSFSDTGLSGSTTYYYRIRAYDGALSTPYSSTASATTLSQPPTVTTSGGSAAYTENGSAVAVDSGLTLSDADDTNLEGAVIQITGNYASGQDVLNFTNQNGISGSWDAGTGRLTLSGTATLANYQTALRSITYSNSSENPSTSNRTISFTVNDGDSNSTAATRTVTVAAVNDAPVLGGIEGGALTLSDPGTATAITASITVSDADDTLIEGATIQITGNYANGEDVLAFTNTANITGSWDAGTGTLTLSGSDTIANYQAAVRAVTYQNTSGTPSTLTRTVSFTVNDGSANSNTVTRGINFTPAAPSGLAGTAISSSRIDLSWTDNSNLEDGFKIERSADGTTGWTEIDTVAAGVTTYSDTGLSASTTYYYRIRAYTGSNHSAYVYSTSSQWDFESGISGWYHANSGSGSTSSIINSSPGAVGNGALQLTYDLAGMSHWVLTATSFSGTPRDWTNYGGVSFYFYGVNSGLNWSVKLFEQGGSAQEAFSAGFTDNSAGWRQIVIPFSAFTRDSGTANDGFQLDQVTQIEFIAGTGGAITGTVAFDEIGLTGTSTLTAAPGSATATAISTSRIDLSWTDVSGELYYRIDRSTDGGGNWSELTELVGGTTSYSDTTVSSNTTYTYRIVAVNSGGDSASTSASATTPNVASTLAGIEGTTLSYTENDAATAITGSITISDADDTNIEGATVQITGNYQNGQDVLSFTNTANITGSWDASTGTLTLSGTDTLANYQAALRSITYQNTSDNPSTSTRTVSFTVNDGTANSNTVTRDVSVAAVNDAPTLGGIEGTNLSYTENGAAAAITSSITVTDPDDTLIEGATIQITGNYASGEDVLSFTNTANITGSWDAATGTLTLSGTDTIAAYQAALRLVQYQNTSDNPSTLNRIVSFYVSDGTDTSAAATRTIAITAVNDPPVVTTSPGSAAYVEDGGAVIVDAGVTGSDPDSANLAAATVRITGNYVQGEDVLNFTDQNGITGTWDASLGRLQLLGAASVADYQAALRSVTYSNTSQDPSSATRTISFTLGDGTVNGNTATRTLTVTPVNDAPTVATPASAPAAVNGATANLSVLGADVDDGESGLIYTWTVTSKPAGAADPTYSRNGTNAAKSTTATFNRIGTYTFQVTISDGSASVTSSVSVTVNPTLTSIVVSPATATLDRGQSQVFSATARDQFGQALAAQPAFTWSSTGSGVVDASGTYTAGAPGTATITAASGGVTGNATVTISNQAPSVVTPAAASPATTDGTTTDLSVLGDDDGLEPNLTYTWSVTDKPSGAADPTYSSNGANAAKNTTATFFRAGTYTFTVTISDGSLSVTSSVVVTVTQKVARIVVSPGSAATVAGQTQQFTASAYDQFDMLHSTQPAFTWSIDAGGKGSISSGGLYSAPKAAGGTATIRATAGARSGTATVTITSAAPAEPSALAAAASTESQIQLVWSDNSTTEDVFQIERSSDGVTWAMVGSVAANSTQFIDGGLNPDTTYYYRVRAVAEDVTSDYSDIAGAKTFASSSEPEPSPGDGGGEDPGAGPIEPEPTPPSSGGKEPGSPGENPSGPGPNPTPSPGDPGPGTPPAEPGPVPGTDPNTAEEPVDAVPPSDEVLQEAPVVEQNSEREEQTAEALSERGEDREISRGEYAVAMGPVVRLPGEVVGEFYQPRLPTPAELYRAVSDSAIVQQQVEAVVQEVYAEASSKTRTVQWFSGAAATTTATVSIGYLLWALRAGSFLASMLTALPFWKWFDPLPVLDSWESERDRKKKKKPGEAEDEEVKSVVD